MLNSLNGKRTFDVELFVQIQVLREVITISFHVKLKKKLIDLIFRYLNIHTPL